MAHDRPTGAPPSGLGRGLTVAHPAARVQRSPRRSRSRSSRIRRNPYQPRQRSDQAELESSPTSIREHGVLQPILVTERSTATSSSPASAGCGPPSWPAWSGSPRSSASSPTATSSSSHWSRTSSARTSTRSRRRGVPPAHRRVRLDPGAGGDARRPSPGDRREHAAAARHAPSRPGRVAERPIDRRPRTSASAASATAQARLLGAVIARGLSVRQTEELARRLRDGPAEPDAKAASASRDAGPGARTCRRGPAPGAGHEGEPRPVAQGWTDRDRVLQRRGLEPALRPADRRNRVTEPSRAVDAGTKKRRFQGGGRRLHRREHPGPRGPRGGPSPAGHVHRLDRRPRPAPPRVGGRRQLDRRGDGRLCDADRRHDPRGRHGRGPGRRPRRSGRPPFDGQGRPRGRAHRAPRRRQVRRRRLQGVGRPARRRRQRRQRPVRVDAGRVVARRLRSGSRSTAAASPTGPVKKIGPANGRRGTTHLVPGGRRDVRDDRLLVRH